MAEIPWPTYQPPTNPLTQMQSGIGVLQGMQGLQGQQIQQQQQQLELGQKRMNLVHDQLGAIAALPNPTIDDVKQAASTLYRAGIPQDQIMQALQTVPSDPQAIKAWATQHMAGIADHAQRLGLGYGVPITNLTDQGTQYGTQFPQAPGKPQFQGGTFMPKLPSTTELSRTVPYRTKEGQIATIRTTPANELAIASGEATVDDYGRIIPVRKGGAAPTAAAPAATAAPPVTGGQLPGTGGGGIAEPAIGAVETQRNLAENAAEIEKRIVNSQTEAPQRQADLATLEADMKKFQTGPYANWTLNAKRGYNDILNRLPPSVAAALPFHPDPKEIAAQENFVKTAGLLAQRQFAAIGGTGTDSKLDSAIKTNPGEALSGMGNQQIIAMLHGNEDAMTARDTALAEWKKKNPSGTADQFQRDFNKSYNPRAFQWARMNPEDRIDMARDMMKNDPPAFQQLKQAINKGIERGWFDESTVAGPPAPK